MYKLPADAPKSQDRTGNEGGEHHGSTYRASYLLASALMLLAAPPLAAAPLKIGVVAPLTGPGAESGRFQIQGAELAVDEVNKAGGVLGRPIELVIEDDQTTNPGVVLAFSKLAGDAEIPAFIGSIRSTQIHAMAPDVLKLGKPVMIGGTDPQLTHAGNPWLFRFRPNDSYSARVIADFGVNTLKLRSGRSCTPRMHLAAAP